MFRISSRRIALTAIATLCLLPTLASATQSDGPIIIEDACAGPHEAGPADDGGCLCDLGFFWQFGECRSPANDWLNGELCSGFAGCGSGGGGGGGGGTPPAEPEEECTPELAGQMAEELLACDELRSVRMDICDQRPAVIACIEGMWPEGQEQCASLHGIEICDVPGVGRLVGTDDELFDLCVEEWDQAVGPAGTEAACVARADLYYDDCLTGVGLSYPQCAEDEPSEPSGPYGSTTTTTHETVYTSSGESGGSIGWGTTPYSFDEASTSAGTFYGTSW